MPGFEQWQNAKVFGNGCIKRSGTGSLETFYACSLKKFKMSFG
jgi:hypothetical protein